MHDMTMRDMVLSGSDVVFDDERRRVVFALSDVALRYVELETPMERATYRGIMSALRRMETYDEAHTAI